mgnify:CR=1 FL=1
MKEEWKVWIKGVSGRGDEVIKKLIDLGAKNAYSLMGSYEKTILYIDYKGNICCTGDTSEIAYIIKDNYKEIKLSDNWKDGDILVDNIDPDSFIVFRRVDIAASEKDGKLINKLSVVTHAGVSGTWVFPACVAGTLEDIIKHYHKASQEELERINSSLTSKGLKYDAYKKKVMRIMWKPIDGDLYYHIAGSLNFCERSIFKSSSIYCIKDISNGNYFKTIEETESARKELINLLKLRKDNE